MGISAFAYSKEDTASAAMPQIPARTICRRYKSDRKNHERRGRSEFRRRSWRRGIVSLEGKSSEGEMFTPRKRRSGTRISTVRILINESDVEQLETGGRYWCEIRDGRQPGAGKITAKA